MAGGEHDGLIDATDRAVLDQIREAWTEADPVPPDLVETIHFALDLDLPAAQVMSAMEQNALPAAKGDEHTRLITFDGPELVVMVSIAPVDGGGVRIDGWLTPVGAHRIGLRTSAGRLAASSDHEGRFAFGRVPRGLAQLTIHAARDLITPAIVL